MIGRKRYKNPPVREVICEFRFDEKSQWDATIPGLIYEELKDLYPVKRQGNEVEIQFGPQGINQSVKLSDRVQLLNQEENVIIQIAPHLLVINLLTPYTNWEEYLKIIDQTFSVYRKVANPINIVQNQLRYINEIIFSHPIEMEEYFEFYPFLGKNLPQNFESFIVGVEIPFENENDFLRLQMQSGQGVSIVLDLIYSHNKTGIISFDSTLAWLDKAHRHIIQTFESCIKDNLRQLFEEES